MLSIITNYLRDTEFTLVGTARDGFKAVTAFRELRPELVLLDLVMPGQSGQDTLRQILELQPEASVAIVSSLGSDDVAEECVDIGAKAYLKKPFARDDLIEFLRALVN
jgi:two-component system chemotaxis response regulator CheY